MNPTDTTLESEIITLVPPPASKPPRSSLAVAAFIASLMPLPLVYTLSAVPLALASLIGIGRSRTRVRGVGFALAALGLCVAQWLFLGVVALGIMFDHDAHMTTADAFIPLINDAEAMRPYLSDDITDEAVEHLAEVARMLGPIGEWRLTDSDYKGLTFGENADATRFYGKYEYNVETATGPVWLQLQIQTLDETPTVLGVNFRRLPPASDTDG